jgi:hypothetical protein
MRLRLLSVEPSPRPAKKLVAVFDADGKTRSVHFGAAGYGDYIKYHALDPRLAEEKRKHYIARHSRGAEHWTDPMSPGALSRYLLWEKSSLAAAIKGYQSRFDV